MWLRDYHVDGLRLDAVHAIVDTSAVHLLEQLAIEVHDLCADIGRRLHLIAESDLNDPRLIWPRDAGGYGLDAQWSDDFHHAVHAVLTGERSGYYADFGRLSQIAIALQRGYVYAGEHSRFRQRRHGRPPGDVPGWRFLGYLQNHDQVGNRAAGERSSHLMSAERLRIGAALVATAPFVPMFFQGEEWGASTPFLYFTDHQDPELGRAVSHGRRREFASFGWDPEDVPDPQDEDTFLRSKLDWAELDKPDRGDLLAWHRSLIALRRRRPELTDGRMDRVQVAADDEAGTLVVRRGGVTVTVRLAPDGDAVAIDEGGLPVDEA
jgi:maltooligosyltrehalose trehalohydrolase